MLLAHLLTSDRQIILWFIHDQDWARSVAHHAFGHRSQHQSVIPRRPCVPMTIASALSLAAKDRMVSAAFPCSTASSGGGPPLSVLLLTNSCSSCSPFWHNARQVSSYAVPAGTKLREG